MSSVVLARSKGEPQRNTTSNYLAQNAAAEVNVVTILKNCHGTFNRSWQQTVVAKVDFLRAY